MPDMHWIWDEISQSDDTRSVIARVGVRPYQQGHIQELYPANHKPGWKAKSRFLFIQIRITKAQFDKFNNGRALKLKFKEYEGGFLSDASLNKHIKNATYKTKEEFEEKGIQPKIELTDRVIDLSTTMKTQVEDAPMTWRDNMTTIAPPKEIG